MRFTMISVGTRGDVQPYVALGVELRRAGHEVRFATHANFAAFITGQGLEFANLGGDPVKLVDGLMKCGTNPADFALTYYRFASAFFEEALENGYRACQDADAVLYTNQTSGGSHPIVEKLNVPAFRMDICPFDRTREFTAVVWPFDWDINGLSHQVWQYAIHLVFRARVNRYRRRIGLSNYSLRYPYNDISGRPIPVLYAYSPHVIPRPKEWGDHIHITGYWFLDQQQDWQPPAALLDFLADGPAPVYVGFGSMSDADFERVTHTALAALKQNGQRGLLLTGWGGLGNGDLPDTVFKLDAAPHEWLFPRMAAVAHHGGSGTTGAGLRAGKPTLIVPFLYDQPFWGKWIHKLGVGPAPIPRHKLTVENFATALKTAATDEGLRDRAALGEKICAENGAVNAARLIERYMTA
ncbi:MAG: glycosyltransferase family 1 protein [Chloroflexi bacterium]|nr:glycosyltransferase family 1 protein [Chloroflexota bacterium]